MQLNGIESNGMQVSNDTLQQASRRSGSRKNARLDSEESETPFRWEHVQFDGRCPRFIPRHSMQRQSLKTSGRAPAHWRHVPVSVHYPLHLLLKPFPNDVHYQHFTASSRGLVEHSRRLLRCYYDLSQTYKGKVFISFTIHSTHFFNLIQSNNAIYQLSALLGVFFFCSFNNVIS